MKRVLLRHVTLATMLGLAACASRGATAGAADPAGAANGAAEPAAAAAHDAHAAHMPDLPATAGPGYTVADVRFMQHMIGHHAQAVVMAVMAPTHGAGENVRKLAQKIDISQRDEIVFMRDWLEDRGQVAPDSMQAAAMMMPGMLTAAQLAQLDAARGGEFDRLFLTFMIHHHEGALQMVDELFANPLAAQDPDVFRFVTDVVVDQQAEIGAMTYLLNRMPVNGEDEFR